MSVAITTFLVSVAAGVAAVPVIGGAQGSPFVWVAAVAGALVSVVGGAFGRPQAVYSGAAVLLGAYGSALAAGAPSALETLVVALAIWLHVELQMRSMELRPSHRPTLQAWLSWGGASLLVALATVLLWLLVGLLERGAPSGGLVFRILALAVVVVVAVVVSGLPWRGLPGSRETRS